MDEQTLDRIVRRVATRPEFLAAVFEAYRHRAGPAAGDLAGHLGVAPAGLLWLSLYRRPRPDWFEADCRAAAADFGADPYRLAAVVRFVEAAEAMTGSGPPADAGAGGSAAARPDDDRGTLAAARARPRGRRGLGPGLSSGSHPPGEGGGT